MIRTENFEKVEITSVTELHNWLLKHHSQAESVWLVTFKKVVPTKYVSTAQVLDELLCFGWIDGIRRKLDEQRTMQLIGPRRAQHWAQSYKERALNLINEGRMKEAGHMAIERSRDLGLWDFMQDVDALIQPSDLKIALAQYPSAQTNFDAFSPSVQRFTLRWIKLAKTAKTRMRRIEQTAKLAQINERIPGL